MTKPVDFLKRLMDRWRNNPRQSDDKTEPHRYVSVAYWIKQRNI